MDNYIPGPRGPNLTWLVYLLVCMWKENRFGIIWFTLAVIGFCAFALLAGYQVNFAP